MAKSPTSTLRRAGNLICAAPVFFALLFASAAAEDAAIAKLRAAERKSFTDRELVAGFMKLTFGGEFPVAGRVDRIRKFDGPVRIHIDNRATPDRSEQIAAVVSDIAERIQNLDIALAENRRDANLTVTLILDRDLPRTVRALQRRKRTQDIQRSLAPRCLSDIRRDGGFRIVRSEVIVAADIDEFVFLDCAYEQLLRALGPINDDPTLPWTMFNDNVQMGFFGRFDQYLLNILYDRRIRPGMTEAQVRALLPEVLPAVRAWLAKLNKSPK
jgi:hypothetical protein